MENQLDIGQVDKRSKFKEFLNKLVASENKELYDTISSAYDILFPDQPIVKRIPIVSLGTEDICPHCQDVIHEKSLYYDGTNWYHRPCIDYGPIVFIGDETDVDDLDIAVSEYACNHGNRYIVPQKVTSYDGDCSIPDSVEYVFEAQSEKYEVPHIEGKANVKTSVKPEDRELDNMPRFSNGKSKVRFQDWLGIKSGNGVGKSSNGKWYGWSHRAVYGFGIGDKVKKGDVAYDGKEYTIKTEEQAKKTAERFHDGVS